MILFEILRRDKFQRLFLTIRQEGFRSGMHKAWRYLSARLSGHGLSSLHRGPKGSHVAAEYMALPWLELAEHDAFHVSNAPALLQKKRKIAMIGDLNLPQCRKYRVEQLAELWALKGVAYEFSHYEDVQRSIAIMQDATHVMFYRLASMPVTSMLAYEARRLRLPILYDLDDPLFSVSAYGTYQNMKALPAWRKTHFMNEAPRYLDVMNASDIVSVSTPGMVAHTKLYTPRPVHMRRNFADRIALESGAHAMQNIRKENGTFRLCFASGSQGHEIDFAEIQDDVIGFLDGGAGRKLVILGHFDKSLLPEALHGRVEEYPFTSYTDYLSNLATVDVAVMPLADDLFNRCKSGVRVLDAASVGVPSIVGDVSDMAALVEPGKTGHVVSTGQSWRDALEDMAGNSPETLAMGKAARSTLENRWIASTEQQIVDPELIDWVCS